MTLKEFLKSKYFFIQLLLAAFLAIAILWLALKFLDIYTLHSRTIEVPDLERLDKEDAQTVLDDNNLNYNIRDSIYDADREKGTVAAQDPAAGNEVKRGRTIYLTTVAELPEMVTMPELTDLSLRQAIAILDNHGLKVGELEYVSNIAKNAVIEQKYKDGAIEPETKLEKGTPIDLVLGDGLSAEKVPVPFVVGLDRHEAMMKINRASLNLGEEIYLDDDTVNVKVYEQEPSALEEVPQIEMGRTVDLYYRSVEEFDFESYLEEIQMVDVPLLYGKTPEEARELIRESSLTVGSEVFENDVSEEDARVYEQDPDYFDELQIKRGSEINIWYRALEDFDEEEEEEL